MVWWGPGILLLNPLKAIKLKMAFLGQSPLIDSVVKYLVPTTPFRNPGLRVCTRLENGLSIRKRAIKGSIYLDYS